MKPPAKKRVLSSALGLEITAPRSGQAVQIGQVAITGIVTAPRGYSPQSLKAQLDSGATVDETNHLGPGTVPPHSSVTVYSFAFDVQVATVGQHVIVATVIDNFGRSTSLTVQFLTSPGFCQNGVLWQNWAGTAGVQTGSVTPKLTCTPASLADIIQIVRQAEAANMRVHAFRTKWSMSDCSITRDNMVDMEKLQRPIQKVQQALSNAAVNPDLIFHVEAGIPLKGLYENLANFGIKQTIRQGASALVNWAYP